MNYAGFPIFIFRKQPSLPSQIEKIRHEFRARFGTDPAFIASAPGRVNLIGEHIDYLGGHVLPIAIDRETLFAILPCDQPYISGFSMNFHEAVVSPFGDFNTYYPAAWFRYVLGVLREVHHAGYATSGFQFCILGNVPMGSGLSSSATVSVATLTALQAAFDFALEKKEAALLCQRAENSFVGVKSGIMDHFISIGGVRDHALRIQCDDLSVETIPANVPGCTWLVVDSKKRRSLVDCPYNLRIEQCISGYQFLKLNFPQAKASAAKNIPDLSMEDLLSLEKKTEPILFKRIRHIVTENARVHRFCSALKSGDIETLGQCLYASHQSLRDDMEVSCPELDDLVEFVSAMQGTVGARLTGAGFGGCLIVLVRDVALCMVISALKNDYPLRLPGLTEKVECWPIAISHGASVVFSLKGVAKALA